MGKARKIFLFALVAVLVLLAGVSYYAKDNFINDHSTPDDLSKMKTEKEHNATTSEESNNKGKKGDWVMPLDKPEQRITKKPFGIYITPENSPVENERFRGYHTGADWEALPSEIGSEVKVKAVCTGELVSKRYASGYGGVAVQSCRLSGEPVTVIYGHLDRESIDIPEGGSVKAGEILGYLGKHQSEETDGERKHLHLGIHKGERIELKGYVDSERELSDWIDPCFYVCGE